MGGNRSRKAPNDRPTGRASSPREVICLFLSFIHEGPCLRPDPVLDTEETARKNGQIPGLLERRGWPGRETVLTRTRKGNGRSPWVPGRGR